MAKKNKTSTKEPETISSSATDQTVVSFPEGAIPSESFPERRPTDVDVANIKDPDKSYKGEHTAPLNGETFVVLDGKHKEVPDRYDGHTAAVIAYPTAFEHDPDTGVTTSFFPSKGKVTVRELSQGQILELPMDAFKKVSTNGRAEVLGFA